MQVVFYNNSSGNEHVTKSLTEVSTFDVELKDSCSVQNPVLLLSGKYLSANYCYISDFDGRYYYIDDITQIRRNLWQYTLRCDVLMSFAEKIKANVAILRRTADKNYINMEIPDDKQIVIQKREVFHKEFPGAFEGVMDDNGNVNMVIGLIGFD